MAINKNNEFTDQDVQIAEFAKALAHPARVAILKILAKSDKCFCSCFVDELPIAQSTVSQHLKALKKAGLIQGHINPPQIKYCINPENWQKAQSIFGNFFDSKESITNCE